MLPLIIIVSLTELYLPDSAIGDKLFNSGMNFNRIGLSFTSILKANCWFLTCVFLELELML